MVSIVVLLWMLVVIVVYYVVVYVEIFIGFKWLVCVDVNLFGILVYVYEEVIGYCVDFIVVCDKDGISVVVLVCDLVVVFKG